MEVIHRLSAAAHAAMFKVRNLFPLVHSKLHAVLNIVFLCQCMLVSVHFDNFHADSFKSFVKTAFRYSIVCFGDTWRQASDILTSRVRNMHALVGARRNFCNVIFLPRLSSDSHCVPVVERVDPTLTVTDKEANIGHLQFSDIVLCRFVRCFSSHAFHCQFQPGNGYGIVTQKCYWRNWQIINILTSSVTYIYNPHGHRFTT